MGLLIGKLNATLPSEVPLYQAVVLSQALTEIVADYPYQLRNIRLHPKVSAEDENSNHTAVLATAVSADKMPK